MSNDTDLKFIALLRQLGLSLDLDNFDSRLLLQKKMYLLQSIGLDLNLRYGWYIRGPYSTDLSHMAYRLQPISNDDRINAFLPPLSEEEMRQLSVAKHLFATIDGLGEDKEYWYELAASLLFLKHNNYPKPRNDDELLSALDQKKPRIFKDMDVRKALDILRSQQDMGR